MAPYKSSRNVFRTPLFFGTGADSALGGLATGTTQQSMSTLANVGHPRRQCRPSKARALGDIGMGAGMILGSKNRKPWDKLFFDGNYLNPLGLSDSGAYKNPMEMVRIAPSASNLQPWRIIKEKNKEVFHFFIKKSKFYQRRSVYLNLQFIDMGISLCHFELAASELGLGGKWEVIDGIKDNKKYPIPPGVDYIISWSGS